jgi:hypothetical protein
MINRILFFLSFYIGFAGINSTLSAQSLARNWKSEEKIYRSDTVVNGMPRVVDKGRTYTRHLDGSDTLMYEWIYDTLMHPISIEYFMDSLKLRIDFLPNSMLIDELNVVHYKDTNGVKFNLGFFGELLYYQQGAFSKQPKGEFFSYTEFKSFLKEKGKCQNGQLVEPAYFIEPGDPEGFRIVRLNSVNDPGKIDEMHFYEGRLTHTDIHYLDGIRVYTYFDKNGLVKEKETYLNDFIVERSFYEEDGIEFRYTFEDFRNPTKKKYKNNVLVIED